MFASINHAGRKRFAAFSQNHLSRFKVLVNKQKNQKREQVKRLLAIAEDGDTDSDSSIETSEVEQRLLGLIKLLGSNDVYQNRLALRRLIQHACPKSSMKLMPYHEDANTMGVVVANMIVYGDGPFAPELRTVLARFIADFNFEDSEDFVQTRGDFDEMAQRQNKNLQDHDQVNFFEPSDMEDTAGNKALHMSTLQVVASSLERVLLNMDSAESLQIDFRDYFWQSIIVSLMDRIENGDSTSHGLVAIRTLRLLHTLEPTLVTPLLRHTLLPYIIHLRDHGETHNNPRLELEAGRLLSCASALPKTRLCI